MTDPNHLARRYVAIWNEGDPERRRRTIADLFSADIAHFTRSLEAHGHAQMEKRIIGSHEKWVRDAAYEFRPLGEADGHHDIVRLRWQMVSAGGGPATSVGSDVLILAADGRIRIDYQFVDPM